MRWTIGMLGLSVVGLIACGGGTSGGGGAGGESASSSGAGGAATSSSSSAASASTSTSTSASSGSSSTSGSSSSSGAGLSPFGAPCTMNSDCMSMLCHNFNTKGMRCTKTCTTNMDCPAGSMCGGMMVCSVP